MTSSHSQQTDLERMQSGQPVFEHLSASQAQQYQSCAYGHIDHVVVPGTFDPVTYGHLDVIRRAHRLFPKVTVAVAASVKKRGQGTAFSQEERVQMIRDSLAEMGLAAEVEVVPFEGLLVDICRELGAGGVVKGLRAMTDFESELQQADLNAHLTPDLESIFVMSTQRYGYLSSSIVRELAEMGAELSLFVPKNVELQLRRHYGSAEA